MGIVKEVGFYDGVLGVIEVISFVLGLFLDIIDF